MSLLADLRTRARHPSWAWAGRLVLAAFVAQALASLVVWFLVNDRSRQGAWSNTDFEQWAALSIACAVFLAVLGGTGMRRWAVAWAVAAGCLLAMASGWAVFIGYAVVNSA